MKQMTKFTSVTKGPSSTQKMAKKHLKVHLKRIRNREYCRLRDMVPAIANKQKVSKVTVIEEAVRYIDELHRALASRLANTDSLVVCDNNGEQIKSLVHSMIPADFFQRKAPVTDFEKQQRLPLYLTQTKGRRPTRFNQ